MRSIGIYEKFCFSPPEILLGSRLALLRSSTRDRSATRLLRMTRARVTATPRVVFDRPRRKGFDGIMGGRPMVSPTINLIVLPHAVRRIICAFVRLARMRNTIILSFRPLVKKFRKRFGFFLFSPVFARFLQVIFFTTCRILAFLRGFQVFFEIFSYFLQNLLTR